ncbi:MAG: hypothetical protein L3J45_07710 [Flavobacteriaceae bacterium]|nr:hypothetical protein [Flavobacteriaceae bacterium]
MGKKVMISCDEASTICDKTQYNEATFWDKLKLQLHLFLCKKCGLYSEQNKMMSKIFKTHLSNHSHHQLADADKKAIEAELKKQMN